MDQGLHQLVIGLLLSDSVTPVVHAHLLTEHIVMVHSMRQELVQQHTQYLEEPKASGQQLDLSTVYWIYLLLTWTMYQFSSVIQSRLSLFQHLQDLHLHQQGRQSLIFRHSLTFRPFAVLDLKFLRVLAMC